MSTPSLTEFLLARIAEDEAVAHESVADRARLDAALDMRTLDGPDRSFYADADPLPHVSVGADRVLAECEARRRIVDNATNMHTSGPDWDEACRILATVYADHDDFDETWRP